MQAATSIPNHQPLAQEEQLKAISAEEKANPREFAKVPRPLMDGNGWRQPSDEVIKLAKWFAVTHL